MSLATCAKAVLHEWRSALASVPPHVPPPKLWIARLSPGAVYALRYGMDGESGVYFPDSRAAAAVTTLNDEPGGRRACNATETVGELGFVQPSPMPISHRARPATRRSFDASPFGS